MLVAVVVLFHFVASTLGNALYQRWLGEGLVYIFLNIPAECLLACELQYVFIIYKEFSEIVSAGFCAGDSRGVYSELPSIHEVYPEFDKPTINCISKCQSIQVVSPTLPRNHVVIM